MDPMLSIDPTDRVSGVEGVLEKVAAVLSANLPQYISALAAEKNLNEPRLRNDLMPKLISPSERKNLSLNDYPAILLVPDNVTSHENGYAEVAAHPAFEGGSVDGVRFQRTYPIRLWAYYMGSEPDFEKTATARNRLELCVWRCLFDHLQLAYNAVLNPDSYEVNFSPVGIDAKASRSIAGFYASMKIGTTESLSAPVQTAAHTFEVDESRLT